MKTSKLLTVLTIATVAVAVSAARAAALTTVPMQGPMVHVGIEYAEHDGVPHFHIHVEDPVPMLTPLSLSHPSDQFDNTDPWFGELDPSAEGRAFNRQYGFVLDGGSDPLPAGYGIWIRQLSATPGLEAFRYRTSPDTWSPMFGTDGSRDTLQWNLGMFHPAYTAPAGVGQYFATYQAFLVDADKNPTGVSAQFQLEWNAIPEPTTAIMTVLGLGAAALTIRRRKA